MAIKVLFFAVIFFLLNILFAQQPCIFEGHADLSEAEGVKGKSLEIARCRAMQKAAEYIGVSIESKTGVKNWQVEYDEIHTKAKAKLHNLKEVYCDWDRGDKDRVLVILYALVEEDKEKEALNKEQASLLKEKIQTQIEKFSLEIKQEKTLEIQIADIVHKSTGLCGSLSSKIKEILKNIVHQIPSFFLIEQQGLKGIKVRSYHSLSATYEERDNNIDIALFLKDPQEEILKKFEVIIPFNASQATAFLPPNPEVIQESLQGFIEDKTGKFTLEITTDRGKKGAIYKHGETMKLEVMASQNCYLQIYYLQANGELVQIFPNAYNDQNWIEGNKVYTIPDSQSKFIFEIDCSETWGMEVIKAVASLKPLKEIPGQKISHGMKGIQVKPNQVIEEQREHSPDIVEATCTVMTEKK